MISGVEIQSYVLSQMSILLTDLKPKSVFYLPSPTGQPDNRRSGSQPYSGTFLQSQEKSWRPYQPHLSESRFSAALMGPSNFTRYEWMSLTEDRRLLSEALAGR